MLLVVLSGIDGLKAHYYYRMLCAMVLFELSHSTGFSGNGFYF